MSDFLPIDCSVDYDKNHLNSCNSLVELKVQTLEFYGDFLSLVIQSHISLLTLVSLVRANKKVNQTHINILYGLTRVFKKHEPLHFLTTF